MLPSTSMENFHCFFTLFTCEIGTDIQSSPKYVFMQKICIMQNNMLRWGELGQYVLAIVLLGVGK